MRGLIWCCRRAAWRRTRWPRSASSCRAGCVRSPRSRCPCPSPPRSRTPTRGSAPSRRASPPPAQTPTRAARTAPTRSCRRCRTPPQHRSNRLFELWRLATSLRPYSIYGPQALYKSPNHFSDLPIRYI